MQLLTNFHRTPFSDCPATAHAISWTMCLQMALALFCHGCTTCQFASSWPQNWRARSQLHALQISYMSATYLASPRVPILFVLGNAILESPYCSSWPGDCNRLHPRVPVWQPICSHLLAPPPPPAPQLNSAVVIQLHTNIMTLSHMAAKRITSDYACRLYHLATGFATAGRNPRVFPG